jgi:long-chain fatty acid transport protein
VGLRKGICVGGALALLAPLPAAASGFAVEHQNARAMGSAYAGAQARAGDAGFLVYNPAAIAGLGGLQTSSNAIVLWGGTGYKNARSTLFGSVPAGGLASDDDVLPPAFVMGSAIAAPLSDRLTLGFSLTTPFGLKSEYDVRSAARYHAQDASLLTMLASPTLAYEVTEKIAIGASLKVEYMNLTASTVVDAGGVAFANGLSGFAPASSDLFAQFKGDDVAFGFAAGLQAELHEGVRLGFSYTSKMEHAFDGEVEFQRAGSAAATALNALVGLFADTGFQTSLTFPATYAAGLSVALCEKLDVLASASLTRWSAFEEVVFDFDNPAQPPEIITAGWKDSIALSLGADYRVAKATAARAGFSYDQTPVRARTAGPRIPDTDRRWLTAGLSHALSERIEIDFAAGLNVAPKTRRVRLDGTLPGDALRGALEADIKVNTYAASLRMKYDF